VVGATRSVSVHSRRSIHTVGTAGWAPTGVPARVTDMSRRLLVLALVVGVQLAVIAPETLAAPPGAAAAGGQSRTGFGYPVQPPTVLTAFDPPDRPWLAGHRGVDLAAAVGTPVRAAGSGRVVYAAPLAGRGVVSIEHAGGLRTTYEPVMASVHAGDEVAAGQVIGVLEGGHASCAPASCLHWGARLPDDTYIDPMLLVTGLRVRLKPWAA
jgi:murein DD-endopeptidase MepM/ murein hydrolase activator NlpD